jgi:hypothetical protein
MACSERRQPRNQTAANCRIERLRRPSPVSWHGSRNEMDRAEMGRTVGQGMQSLEDNQHAKRRIKAHRPPADERGDAASHQQSGGSDARDDLIGIGKQRHFGEDRDGPQHAEHAT